MRDRKLACAPRKYFDTACPCLQNNKGKEFEASYSSPQGTNREPPLPKDTKAQVTEQTRHLWKQRLGAECIRRGFQSPSPSPNKPSS